MKFDAIDIGKKGNIRCSLQRWARNKKPFLSIVQVAFSGDYRTGSAGAPDAHYMDGMNRIVDAVWNPSALILDLRDVDYQWGDEMDLVLQPPTDIIAIVVSSKCERAISTLFYGINTKESVLAETHFFDSLEPAIEFVTQALVADWNSKVHQHPEFLSTADLITDDELRQSS
jgi:hypothetical protein